MAVAAKIQKTKAKEFSFAWEGKDKSGKVVKGEMRAVGEASASAYLRRQGINATKVKRQRNKGKKSPPRTLPCSPASLPS
ncbi:MAG: Type II secretion system F domain [Candidatus Gallionella acididurans]|uniref:Type II secretion system F domain n=1 Tax=Candidatus Gallionella acididurans TaxID=1796491 RepID=A0A139BWS1_9PROT|nr:MAG: Type II secretion system F domain [Candidatus Gallionella acididurans]